MRKHLRCDNLESECDNLSLNPKDLHGMICALIPIRVSLETGTGRKDLLLTKQEFLMVAKYIPF